MGIILQPQKEVWELYCSHRKKSGNYTAATERSLGIILQPQKEVWELYCSRRKKSDVILHVPICTNRIALQRLLIYTNELKRLTSEYQNVVITSNTHAIRMYG